MIVANTGKVTELIEHCGSLQSANEKALLYVAKGRYKIKRMVKTPSDCLFRHGFALGVSPRLFVSNRNH